MTGRFGVRWCLGLLAASLAVIAIAAGGCPPEGPQSCDRKSTERQVSRDGHTVHQTCQRDSNGNLVWVDGA